MKHVISAICDQSLKLCGLSQFVSGSIDNLCSVQHVLCSSNNPLVYKKCIEMLFKIDSHKAVLVFILFE